MALQGKNTASSESNRVAERVRIIEAAYQLLADSNGASVPITDVLSAAGMSTRAFYRHFETKDALLLAMFRNDSDRALRSLRARAARASSARDALHGWVIFMLRLASDTRRRSRALVLISDEVTRARGFRVERERYRRGQDTALADILRRGLIDGSIPDTDPASDAPLIRAVLHEGFEMTMNLPEGSDIDAVTGRVLSFIDRTLGISRGV